MFPRTPHPFLRILPAALPALLAGPSLAVSACGPAQYKCVEPPANPPDIQDAGSAVAPDAEMIPPIIHPTTQAAGEEGGIGMPPHPVDAGPGAPCLRHTRALGECGGPVTTQAIGEDGAGRVLKSDAGAIFSPPPCEVKPGYAYTQACGECGSGC